jgi:Fe-coproporphyrin III synthase
VTAATLTTAMLVRLGEVSNHTFVLPLVIVYPTSRCNSRCMSCDWWKQSGAGDLSLGEIDGLAGSLPSLGTKLVVFSGGEPLLRPEVFEMAALFEGRGLTLHLLTSGILLERFAERVARHFARVAVSLDATTEALYERIRGVAALGTVARGVAKLRSLAPGIPVTARATLHRQNFAELPRLVDFAKSIGLDGISFLSADVSSGAFGRAEVPDPSALALGLDEVERFEQIVERTVAAYQNDFESGFIAESPDRLRRLPQYYAALAGAGPFPPVSCNAPWVSVVIEADGSVRPCFFHQAVGNVRTTPLAGIVAQNLRAFRQALEMSADPVCTRCVCSLKAGWRRAPWIS